MGRRRTLALGVVAVVVILAGVGAAVKWIWSPPVSLNQDGSKRTERITIAQFGDLLLYMPLYIAKDEGLFRKFGIDVEIISTGGDDKTFAAVASGSADFGLADPTFVAIAEERGNVGRVIAMLIDGVPNYGVALSADVLVVKGPINLKGKTVASVPAPSTSYALVDKLYKSAGLSPSILQVAPSGLVAALKAKQADYAVLIEPWASAVELDGGKVVFSLSDAYPHFALTGLTASDATIADRPEVAAKVVQALTEAVKVYYTSPDVALRVALKRFPTESRASVERGLRRLREDKAYPAKGLATTEAAWDPAIALRRELGDLQAAPKPMSAYVDNRFADAAASSPD